MIKASGQSDLQIQVGLRRSKRPQGALLQVPQRQSVIAQGRLQHASLDEGCHPIARPIRSQVSCEIVVIQRIQSGFPIPLHHVALVEQGSPQVMHLHASGKRLCSRRKGC